MQTWVVSNDHANNVKMTKHVVHVWITLFENHEHSILHIKEHVSGTCGKDWGYSNPYLF